MFKKKKDRATSQRNVSLLMSDIVNLLANQEMERNPKPNNEKYTRDEYRLLLKSMVNKYDDVLSATMRAYLAGHFNIHLPKNFSFKKDLQYDILTKEEAKDILGE
jgi:hypothetical protein